MFPIPLSDSGRRSQELSGAPLFKGYEMDFITIIQSFGFPIAACAAMAWYVKYITDENNKRLDDLNRDHKEEVQSLSEALQNNTLALQKLTDFLTLQEKQDDGR